MSRNSNSTLLEALNRASLFLQSHDFPARDAQNYYLFYKDWTLTDLVTHLHQPILAEDEAAFQAILERIVADEPIQYILGYADFKGHRFKVTPDTLIPRSETEGIIDIAEQIFEEKPPHRILDIGTGTGVLAITLQLLFSASQVYGVDISEPALAVAEENSDLLDADVTFIQSDLTEAISSDLKFQLIVSNPPYIGQDEMSDMDESVKKYEPKLALYAENDGYSIYQRLAEEIGPFMDETCVVILEIGWQQGQTVKELFQSAFPSATVYLQQDFNGHDRYVIIEKQEIGGY